MAGPCLTTYDSRKFTPIQFELQMISTRPGVGLESSHCRRSYVQPFVAVAADACEFVKLTSRGHVLQGVGARARSTLAKQLGPLDLRRCWPASLGRRRNGCLSKWQESKAQQ